MSNADSKELRVLVDAALEDLERDYDEAYDHRTERRHKELWVESADLRFALDEIERLRAENHKLFGAGVDLASEIERLRAENARMSREVQALDSMVDQLREELTLANESNAIMRSQLLAIDKRNAL